MNGRGIAVQLTFIRHYLFSVDTIVLLFHSNSNSLCSKCRSKCDFIAANANALFLIVQMDLSSPLSPAHAHIDANNEKFSLRLFFTLQTMVFCNIFAIQMAPALYVILLFCCFLPENKWNRIVRNTIRTVPERQTLNCERVENSMVVFALEIISLITNAFGLTLTFFASPKFYFLLWFTGAAISTSRV